MTISQMSEAIRNGELSSRVIVSRCISAIEESKHLNAVIEINPDALALAERLDSIGIGDRRGTLYGVPILIKDNINTGDRMHTSAGSAALAENIAPEDAPAVSLLREAGAVIIGKTNMTEFSNYMSESMPNGYSSRGGQSLNFFDSEADASGSSTGSAIATAAGLCMAAIGTETCGSIIAPAQDYGIVGIKPTAGLVNNQGTIPISFTLDTPGPIARCVDDARLLLGVLAGRQYRKTPGKFRLEGLRIGVYRTFTDRANPEWIAAGERLVEMMRELGADCVELPEHGIHSVFIFQIMRNEFKYGIDTYLRSMGNPAIPQSLQEIIEYNECHTDTMLKYGQDVLERSNCGAIDDPEYLEALTARNAAICELDAMLDKNGIDVYFSLAAEFGLTTATGFPCITVPIGKTSKGLPIGSFFVARRFKEELLLNLAARIEAALSLQFDLGSRIMYKAGRGREVFNLCNIGVSEVQSMGHVNSKDISLSTGMHCHHRCCEIIYYCSGSQTFVTEGGSVKVKAGEFIVFFPDEMHGSEQLSEISDNYFLIFECAPDTKQLFNMSEAESKHIMATIFSLRGRVVKSVNRKKHHALLKNIIKHYHGKSPLKASLIRSDLTYLFSIICDSINKTISNKPSEVSEDIAKVVSYIRGHVTDPISIEDLSRDANLSPSFLKQKFKSEVGFTPHDYILRQKISEAERLLSTTNMSITSIAYHLSFSSPQHFASVFKKYKNKSPTEYRN